MSGLRKQLDRAAARYAEQKYPGDLAVELLPARGRMRIGRWLTIGAAVAAIFVIAHRHKVVREREELRGNSLARLSVPGIPEMPRGVGLDVPAMPPLPGVPVRDVVNQTSDSKKESI